MTRKNHQIYGQYSLAIALSNKQKKWQTRKGLPFY